MQAVTQALKNMIRSVQSHPYRWGGLTLGFIFVLSTAFLFWPRTVHFSYAGDNCITQPVLLPALFTSEGEHYKLSTEDAWSIAGYPIVSRSICATATTPPTEGSARVGLKLFDIGALEKRITINTPTPPVVSSAIPLEKPVPATKPIELKLSETDEVFEYMLIAKEREAPCDPNGETLVCELSELELSQGKEHEIVLTRHFNGSKLDAVFEEEISILPAIKVKEASVENDATVYGKPKVFTITTDKPLVGAEARLVRHEKEDDRPIETEVSFDSARVTVRMQDEELERPARYSLVLSEAEAEDGSILEDEYSVDFKLSDGPTVQNVNVGTTGVDPNATIVLQLDQPLKDEQDIAKHVSVTGGSAAVSAAGDRIVVRLSNLNRCTDFRITVTKGLLSKHDVKASSDWRFSGRTRCYTVETIGYSKQGRPIQAYYFGQGSRTVLFTGAIHGNELSSKYIMDTWITELEAKARSIPPDKRVVVIPAVNPDGIAVGGRDNANGVNLNRNFATSNWESDIQVSGGVQKGGGGKSALSEPESAALTAFTNRLNPYFIITYHSMGSLVNSNDVGIASAAGQEYARMAGYWFVPGSATADTFGYEITGTYETWLYERGIPAILIELDTHTGNHYGRNSAAMWAMLRR